MVAHASTFSEALRAIFAARDPQAAQFGRLYKKLAQNFGLVP
jgi:hypothetical protein